MGAEARHHRAQSRASWDEASAHLGKQAYEVLTIAGRFLLAIRHHPRIGRQGAGEFGTIDILVNNARRHLRAAPPLGVPAEAWPQGSSTSTVNACLLLTQTSAAAA